VAERTSLVGLTERLVRIDAIQQVAGRDGASLAVAPGAQALVLAGLAEASADVLLVVTATQRDAEQLCHDLSCFLASSANEQRPGALDDPVLLFPSWDTLPLERISPDLATMAQRQAVRWAMASAKPPSVVVAPVRALLQRMTPTVSMPLVVRKGEELDVEELVAGLVRLGYRREPQVVHRGELAVRGGIVDVFGATAPAPVRLDLFGDELERLTVFDVADQRSRRDVDEAWFFACRELVVTEAIEERARQLSSSLPWTAPVTSRLVQGSSFDGMEGWLGFVTDDQSLLTDALSAASSVVLVEPSRVRDRALELIDEEAALVRSLLSTWAGPSVELDVESIALHVPFDRLFARSSAPVIAMPSVPSSDAEPQITSSTIPALTGDPARLAEQLTVLQAQSYTVLVLGSSEPSVRRLSEVLAAEGIDAAVVTSPPQGPGIALAVSELSRGFVWPEPKLAVLAEADITGRRSPHRKARSQQQIADGFFDDLEKGAYVVHRIHGVARFLGVSARTIGGTTRDYMVLEFRGDDRIYLPVDQIDAITPYSGGEAPSLSKMGGSEWQRTRAKAKAAATEVAEELVALYRERSLIQGFAFSPDSPWQDEMEAAFGYELTPDQRRTVDEVKADMEAPRPMDRLIVADVGFGKTEIAVRAVFKAVQDGKQAAVLVPTTLLASQHHQTFTERYGAYPVTVALLSRFLTDKEVSEVLAGLAEGSIDVVIGTHRLLSGDLAFKDLGLLVVDEEQRFGVSHKEAIKRLSSSIDVLTLSANPIPRTLEMALTGIRDLSTVNTPPVDRRPILTYVGDYDERAVAEAIRRELLREGQVFYVHNRILDIDAVARAVAALVPEARVVVGHGQMDEGTLERVMLDFAERRFDVLVCTTIVESGIDMPSVNTMVVDRADRLGLGQLHQLRGRVGRSGLRAYAYLFHPQDLVLSEQAYERLRTIGEYTDLGSGFKIAMRDLEIRGAGNLLGRDQSGHVAAVGYDLYVQLVAEAVAEAKGVVPPELVTVSIDVPGDAHLPESYVPAEDARLEAYRRLAATSTEEEVQDVAAEWQDRYGPLPEAARGLIELALLRASCLRLGIRELSVLPARPGGRTVPLAKLSPLALPASAQIRVRRLLGERAYDESNASLRVELTEQRSAPAQLRRLLDEILPRASEAAQAG
jgi:transcription-repair coupling factor (superfamily II helicase)